MTTVKIQKWMNHKIPTGVGVVALLLTLGLTLLFWKSQNEDLQVKKLKNLGEIRYFDLLLEKNIEKIRGFDFKDTGQILISISAIKDLANFDDGDTGQEINLIRSVQGEYSLKSAQISAYITARRTTFAKIQSLRLSILENALTSRSRQVLDTLFLISTGYPVAPFGLFKRNKPYAVESQIEQEFFDLLLEMSEQERIYRSLRSGKGLFLVDELMAFYQEAQSRQEMVQLQVQQALYILSLLIVLALSFLIARIRTLARLSSE